MKGEILFLFVTFTRKIYDWLNGHGDKRKPTTPYAQWRDDRNHAGHGAERETGTFFLDTRTRNCPSVAQSDRDLQEDARPRTSSNDFPHKRRRKASAFCKYVRPTRRNLDKSIALVKIVNIYVIIFVAPVRLQVILRLSRLHISNS